MSGKAHNSSIEGPWLTRCVMSASREVSLSLSRSEGLLGYVVYIILLSRVAKYFCLYPLDGPLNFLQVASCRNAYSTGARAPLSQCPDMRFRRYVISTAFSRANSTLSEAQANDRKPAPEQRAAMTSRVQLTADSIGRRT